jgi:peptide-methionine (S)-S-oxide reductase
MTRIIRLLGCLLVLVTACSLSHAHAATLPDPQIDEQTATSPGTESITLAGGCFWGIQAVFQHVKGVTQATSGYAGGASNTAQYHTVSAGDTGHAESVQVTYDPTKVTLGKILKVYFAVAHDPTELNRQGPDSGTQYRSTIFYANAEQQKIADAYIKQLNDAKVFASPIVTTLEPLKGFYKAEDYHQNYAKLHPYNPYIMINDAPKVTHLQKDLPDLYVD